MKSLRTVVPRLMTEPLTGPGEFSKIFDTKVNQKFETTDSYI